MSRTYKRILLLMMGGSGTRFGAPVPKQFVEVEGKPTFSYLVEKYASIDFADRMVIVCNGDWVDYTRSETSGSASTGPWSTAVRAAPNPSRTA